MKVEKATDESEQCKETDSTGVVCEVKGPHTQHACPKALKDFLEKRNQGLKD